MGRPPIGKNPMTAAERQRRRRERLARDVVRHDSGLSRRALFDDLKARLRIIQEHAATMSVNVGLYEELNVAAGETNESARAAATSLRRACLLANLIATAATFAIPRRNDDVSFQLYSEPLRDPAFRAHCAERTGLFQRKIDEEAAAFVALFDRSLPLYRAIKPMRDKRLAHISRKSFPTPIIKSVLDLSRNSVEMTCHLSYIFKGSMAIMSTLEHVARMHIRALRRSDQPGRRRR
jgi:hypothetical protein